MGGHYGSIHIFSEDVPTVQKTVETVAQNSGKRFLMVPPIRGWISVFAEENGQDSAIGEALAAAVPNHVLQCIVHDDDVFAYQLYHSGQKADEYNSCPDYFGGPEQPKGGNAEMFRFCLEEEKKRKALQTLLNEERYTFEYERLEKFARILGLPNAVTAYEYLQNGERGGIEQWGRFTHIPDLSAEREAKRATAAAQRARLKALIKDQVLLLDESIKPKKRSMFSAMPVWTFVPGVSELLLCWPCPFSYPPVQISWTQLNLLKSESNDAGFITGSRIFSAKFSRFGDCLVLVHAYGDWTIEVWNWKEKRKEFEHQFQASIGECCFSADESRLFVASGGQIVSQALRGDERVLIADEVPECRAITAHPDGRWIAVGWNGMLGLIDLNSTETAILYGIGGAEDLSLLMPEIFDEEQKNRTLQKAAEQLPAEQVEKLKKGLMRQAQHLIRPNETVMALQFTPDGKRLLCGTSQGLRVFDWEKLHQSEVMNPEQEFDVDGHELALNPADKDAIPGRYVYSVAYDEASERVLFGGMGGAVQWLDLTTGKNGILTETGEPLAVTNIALSPDRKLLGTTRTSIRRGNKNTPKLQVWNYSKL
ncbi:MAG: hypothetical protein H0X66_21585 [Verrucomicrobia bacterium]|nr:hypothetical protein [Verrucomicrobiota bacterium]